MASCRSLKTGNCSDYSRKKLPNRNAPEDWLGAFLFLDRPSYAWDEVA